MSEAQAKLDQLSAEKTSMEQQLFEARRSVEETKIAVSLLQSLQLLHGFVCMCQTSLDTLFMKDHACIVYLALPTTGGAAKGGAAREKGSIESETGCIL